EYFIDDTLKETITTDLTLEKTINYTLEDNALHTLKIVVTDSANATAEKNVSISKGIAPLPAGSTTDEVTSKWMEIKDTFKSGKTSIINTLALKNIDASLNNTLVELSEKIKTSFDSSDASVEDLTNKLTQANNTISQLNTKYKFAYSLDLTVHWFIDCGFKPDFVIYECINNHGKFLVFLTPFNYSVFDIGNLGWTITAREDISKKDSFSINNINQFWGTKIRDTGFNNADMPKDSLNDRYVFWIAIKCL
ncbi:TPA: glycine rich domain-containing protein, partial [Clostridioides difficile]